jgi:anti-anti-sigma factor
MKPVASGFLLLHQQIHPRERKRMREFYPDYLGLGPGGPIEGGGDEGALVVRLVGEFDRYSERMFLGCIRELLSEGHGEVQFDFSEVRFADTSGLRCLFQAQRQFRREGRQLTLTGLPAGLERILLMVSAHGLARAVEEWDGLGPPTSRSLS